MTVDVTFGKWDEKEVRSLNDGILIEGRNGEVVGPRDPGPAPQTMKVTSSVER